MDTLMEMETDVINHGKDYADEAIPTTCNGVPNWRDSDDISHEADTEVFETPSCSPDENSSTTTTSAEGSDLMNTSPTPFKFELSDKDVNELSKPVKEEGHQFPLPNEVAYTVKDETPSDDAIRASSDDEMKDSMQSDQIKCMFYSNYWASKKLHVYVRSDSDALVYSCL